MLFPLPYIIIVKYSNIQNFITQSLYNWNNFKI